MTKKFENRDLKTVSFNVLDKGLGICIIGGEDGLVEEIKIPGIFIKTIVPGGLASLDGRLHEGDQVVSVNGESLLDVTNEKAVEILRKGSEEGFVQLKICRDEKAKQDFKDLCEMYIFSRVNTPINDDVIANEIETNIRNDVDKNLKIDKDIKYIQDNDNLSIDPFVRLKIERLKQSLRFLGIYPNEEEEEEIRGRLEIDENGTVAYGDFVKLAREMFVNRMNPHQDGAFKPITNDRITTDNYLKTSQLSKENQELKTILDHKDGTIAALEREITRYKNDHTATQDELRDLKNKLRLMEEAQKMARKTENDYETVLRHFEQNTLKYQRLADDKQAIDQIQYRLKTAETSKKLHETATDKLMSFAKFVVESLKRRKQQAQRHEMMKAHPSSALSSSLSLTYLDFSSSDDMIMSEADKTINAVNSLLELDALPFGWDVVRTKQGEKVFVNSQTNSVSPIHPSLIYNDVTEPVRPSTNLSAPVYSNRNNNKINYKINNNNNKSYYDNLNSNKNNEDFYYRDYLDKRSL